MYVLLKKSTDQKSGIIWSHVHATATVGRKYFHITTKSNQISLQNTEWTPQIHNFKFIEEMFQKKKRGTVKF